MTIRTPKPFQMLRMALSKTHGLRSTLLFLLILPPAAVAAEAGMTARLELGPVYQQKNEVQVPNDSEGTRFSLEDLAGSGPWLASRLEFEWNINQRHGMRVVLAPFAYSEKGFLEEAVNFEGGAFGPDEPVRAKYKFNSWRVGYRYNFYARDDLQLWVGGTLKVRDAQIELHQGELRSDRDDIGVVPLLYLAAGYQFVPGWRLALDLDGLAGGPGRAIDLSARVEFEASEKLYLGVGYRALEGGVDTDDVYNFAWFNTGFVSLQYHF